MVFLRVRLLQVDKEDLETPTGTLFDPYCAVNVLESVQTGSKYAAHDTCMILIFIVQPFGKPRQTQGARILCYSSKLLCTVCREISEILPGLEK